MDHVWQIHMIGPPEHEMLEAYTTLGFLAARTTRIRLLTLVTGVVYRDARPARQDGHDARRALGRTRDARNRQPLGTRRRREGSGCSFPPTAERFERLEETLQICLQMWSGEDGPYEGRHYRLGRTLNSPQALTSPHPPILIGGSGERKTLRLVARYAQACNLFPGPDLEHKLDVLREHCEREGRDYDEIEKTVLFNFDVGEHGERVDQILESLDDLARLGFTVAHGSVVTCRR